MYPLGWLYGCKVYVCVPPSSLRCGFSSSLGTSGLQWASIFVLLWWLLWVCEERGTEDGQKKFFDDDHTTHQHTDSMLEWHLAFPSFCFRRKSREKKCVRKLVGFWVFKARCSLTQHCSLSVCSELRDEERRTWCPFCLSWQTWGMKRTSTNGNDAMWWWR